MAIKHFVTEKARGLGVNYVIQRNYADGSQFLVYLHQLPKDVFRRDRAYSRPIAAIWYKKGIKKRL